MQILKLSADNIRENLDDFTILDITPKAQSVEMSK
jgi:hypothetical protein